VKAAQFVSLAMAVFASAVSVMAPSWRGLRWIPERTVTKICIKVRLLRTEGRFMSVMILTSTELVVLVAMLVGLVRNRSSARGPSTELRP